MRNLKRKLIIITSCATILFGMCIGEGIAQRRTKQELVQAQNEVKAAQDEIVTIQSELYVTQEDLQLEFKRSLGLSTLLDETTQKLNNAQQVIDTTNEELDAAKMTIADLKSEEYELVYIGDFKYTYYCNEARSHICGYGLGITASGESTEVDWTVAVDPDVIPLGSIIYVENLGFRKAQDTGGAVKGNHIDILLETHSECFDQTITSGGIWILVKKTS